MIIQDKKPVLDRNSDKPVGIVYPIQNSSQAFFGLNYSTRDQIKTNLRMFLMTMPTERMMLTVSGINLYSIIFENDLDEDIIKDEITDAISENFGSIVINDISINVTEHLVEIVLNYSIEFTSETDQLTLIFNAT